MEQSNFLKEYLGVQGAVYAYIRGAGFDITDADDLAQEVAMKLWESYASYMPSQPFVAWAIGVAKNVVRNKRRHDRVRAGTVVDSDICEQIGDVVADTLARENAALAEENEMLEKCIQRLPEPSMRLIRMRYGEGWSLRQMAESLGRTYATVNVTLSRIRNMLADCVQRQKAEIG